MLILEINYKIALDLDAGPDKETFEVESVEEVKKMFKDFPLIEVKGNRVLKGGVPIGTINTPELS